VAGASPSQVQDNVFVLTEFHEVAVGLYLQPSEGPLDSTPALENTVQPPSLVSSANLMSKHCYFLWVIHKDVKQDESQDQLLKTH